MGEGVDRILLPNSPFAVDHAGADGAFVFENSVVCVRDTSREGDCDQISQSAAGDLSGFTCQSQCSRAVHGGHAKNGFWWDTWMRAGERVHFVEHVQSHSLLSRFENRRETIGAQANVDL